jgi:competence protein ComEA
VAPSTSLATSPATTLASSIVVYVAGEVVVPGIYTLASTARVNDAVQAAGGLRATADLGLVNLAAILHDGQRVYVPAVGELVPPLIEVAPPADGTSPTEPVNINLATAEQLDVLPGVGPATAAAIVAHRQQHGPFQSVDQLGDVRGIGPAKLDALRGLVTV